MGWKDRQKRRSQSDTALAQRRSKVVVEFRDRGTGEGSPSADLESIRCVKGQFEALRAGAVDGAMYHGCIKPGSTGRCRPVRAVSDCTDITPAKPLPSNIFWYRLAHPGIPDIPDFRIWEQEAGSSTLSIPTRFVR